MRNIFLCLLIVSLLIACTSQTVSSTSFTTVGLENGKVLRVEKTNNTTTDTGVITGHVYGATQSYSYKFTINENEVLWDGGSSVPKQILFSNQGVYVYFLKEESQRPEVASQDGKTHSETIKTVVPVYERLIDERFFFKLFGKCYWVQISPETYKKMKETGSYFPIPNGNELILPSAES